MIIEQNTNYAYKRTFPHLCEYCYANASKEVVVRNYNQHEKDSWGETITGNRTPKIISSVMTDDNSATIGCRNEITSREESLPDMEELKKLLYKTNTTTMKSRHE